MKIERQQAMVKAVAKAMNQKERQQAKTDKLRNKVVVICNKYGKAIDELNKNELKKEELKSVQDYYINQCGLTVAKIVHSEFF